MCQIKFQHCIHSIDFDKYSYYNYTFHNKWLSYCTCHDHICIAIWDSWYTVFAIIDHAISKEPESDLHDINFNFTDIAILACATMFD